MTAIRQSILSLVVASLVATPAISQSAGAANCSLLAEPGQVRQCMIQSRISDLRMQGNRVSTAPLTKGSLISGEEVMALEAREQMAEMVSDRVAFTNFADGDNRWIFFLLFLLVLLGLSGSGSGGGAGGEPISPS